MTSMQPTEVEIDITQLPPPCADGDYTATCTKAKGRLDTERNAVQLIVEWRIDAASSEYGEGSLNAELTDWITFPLTPGDTKSRQQLQRSVKQYLSMMKAVDLDPADFCKSPKAAEDFTELAEALAGKEGVSVNVKTSLSKNGKTYTNVNYRVAAAGGDEDEVPAPAKKAPNGGGGGAKKSPNGKKNGKR